MIGGFIKQYRGRASVPVRGANFLFSCFLANPYLMLIQQVSVKTLPGAF